MKGPGCAKVMFNKCHFSAAWRVLCRGQACLLSVCTVTGSHVAAGAPMGSDALTSRLARAHASDAGAPGSVCVKFNRPLLFLPKTRENVTRARSIESRNPSIRAVADVTTPTCARRPCSPWRAHSSTHTRDGNGKHTWTLALAGSRWRESLFRYFLLLERCSLKLPPSF